MRPTFMKAVLPAINFQPRYLLSEPRAEPLVSVERRKKEPWKKKRQQKGKASKIKRGGNYLCPKYCCVGKGSVAVPSFSYLRVAKRTQAWQGKARHEEARERKVFILTESVALHFTI